MPPQRTVQIMPLPQTLFGVGAIEQLSSLVQRLKKTRALIVTDRGVAAAGLIAPIVQQLTAAGIETQVFDGVLANPTDQNVLSGGDMLRALGDAAVIAIGGGSSMDASKAIALHGPNGGEVSSLVLGNKPGSPAAPIICVPTTAGTGSETNMFGLITDTTTHRKLYVAHPSTQPRMTILDPALTVGLPRYPTATCGMDVLTHALEALVARNAIGYSDGVALEAIHLVAANLPRVFDDGSNLDARTQMLMASNMAAVAFNVAGLGICHGMGHPLSARLNLPHGQTLATLLPHAMRFNLDVAAAKYARAALALGVGDVKASVADNASAAIAAVVALSARVETNRTLRKLGVTEEMLPELAQDALSDLVTMTNPKRATADDVVAMYRSAMD